MKIFVKTTILFLMCVVCLRYTSITAHATTYDPGAGRLSGDRIPEDFYENCSDSPFTKALPSTNTLMQYGSRKLKSPYTKVKYTHQTVFDDRKILHGIDVSKWQGEIDWAKVKADGIDYAFIQVGFRGYGNSGILNESTRDPYFDINMQNAIANGIMVGVYVFSQATTEAEAIEEANYILDSIGNYPISMPLVIDYEYASTGSGLGGRLYKAKLSKKKATNVCMAFCKEIAEAGYTPMIYANKSMLEDQLNADTLTNAGYRIWLANYTQNTSYNGAFDFWQYSEKGVVSGISGSVDMNFYYAQSDDNFAPAPNSISSFTFTEVEDHIYTGKAIKPEIVITNNNVTLTPNVDYTISYTDNKKIGTATITITGIGNYQDTRKIHFDILPKTPQAVQAKKRTTDSITLAWKIDPSITGYEIHRTTATDGSYSFLKRISNKKTISYKDTKLTSGKCYYYFIRSYKTIGDLTYYSDFSPIKSIYTKTGYTKNALTKTKLPIYDRIPGTKLTATKEPMDSNSLVTVSKNTTLKVIYSTIYKNKTWYYVSYETDDKKYKGFVPEKNVTITKLGKVVKTKKVNVRKKATVYSTKITTLKKNSKVTILSTYKKYGATWYKVQFKKNNKIYKGWISAVYIKII